MSTRELTTDEKAFIRALDLNAIPREAVIAFILSECLFGNDQGREFYNGIYGEYYTSLTDFSNVFYSALGYARENK